MPVRSVETCKPCVMDCTSATRVISAVCWVHHSGMTMLILAKHTEDIFLQMERFAFAALKRTFREVDSFSSAGLVFVQCDVWMHDNCSLPIILFVLEFLLLFNWSSSIQKYKTRSSLAMCGSTLQLVRQAWQLTIIFPPVLIWSFVCIFPMQAILAMWVPPCPFCTTHIF